MLNDLNDAIESLLLEQSRLEDLSREISEDVLYVVDARIKMENLRNSLLSNCHGKMSTLDD